MPCSYVTVEWHSSSLPLDIDVRTAPNLAVPDISQDKAREEVKQPVGSCGKAVHMTRRGDRAGGVDRGPGVGVGVVAVEIVYVGCDNGE